MARKKATSPEETTPRRATRTRSGSAASGASAGRGGAGSALTQETIARRAYELYEARGRAEGFAQQDWEQAERELRSER